MGALGFQTAEQYDLERGFGEGAEGRMEDALTELEKTPKGKSVVNKVRVILNNPTIGSTAIKDAIIKEVEMTMRGLL